MDTEWLSLDLIILPAWMGALFFAFFLAVGALFFPKIHEKLQRFFFPILLFPSFVVALAFIFEGLKSLDRPVVHWIFRKDVLESLRIGFFLDPLALIVTFVFGFVLLVICLRNKPQVQVISAMGLSWVSLAIVASSKTFWTAILGLGIGMLSRVLPILFDHIRGESRTQSLDSLWMSSSKRSWIGILITLMGAAGLVSHGLHLDFFTEGSWSVLLDSPRFVAAGGLLLFGLLVQFIPVVTSMVLHEKWTGYLEEENFIYETAGGWVSVLILYRILPSIRETPWALGIEVTALLFLATSLLSLAFLESKRGAIYFWLANLPLLVLTILPSLQNQTAFLFVAGSVIAFSGLLLCMDHLGNRIDLGLAIFFFLGAFGFVGWSSSLGVVEFFSKIEEEPILGSVVLLIWLLYASFGFRAILRGGESGPRGANIPKWTTAGVLVFIGFGPLLSGRLGVGAIPEVSDWLDGARDWPWVATFASENIPLSWLGFGLSQSIILIAIILGTFVASASALYPFAGMYPKGLQAARGLFGVNWIHQQVIRLLSGAGSFWTEKVSDRVWEVFIPQSLIFVFEGIRRIGEVVETRVDLLTSSRFSYFVRAPSKFVQWFHGGNVRLYAWFALGWVLIISIYLTR